jgi:hypothetical protein
MIQWLQYLGAFVTGSGGAALLSMLAQQNRIASLERLATRRDETLDRHQLVYEASEMLGEMRREIERLRRDLIAVRSECESRQAGVKADVEIMHREVAYWQQVAGELSRDNVQLKAEVERLTVRVRELENTGDQINAS